MITFLDTMTEIRGIVRLRETDLNGNITVERSLRKIKGVSYAFARAIRTTMKIPTNKLLGELNDNEIKKIEEIMLNPKKFGIKSFIFNRRKDFETGEDKHLTGSDLVLETRNDIALMKNIKSYKGVRHAAGLKVRGQKTKSTGRKGSVVGVRKKKQPGKK